MVRTKDSGFKISALGSDVSSAMCQPCDAGQSTPFTLSLFLDLYNRDDEKAHRLKVLGRLNKIQFVKSLEQFLKTFWVGMC